MNLKLKLSFFVLLLFNLATYAQKEYTITGKVTSESDKFPLPGANVLIVGTQKVVTTDADGNFSIPVTSGDELRFSSVGTVTKTIKINKQLHLDVILADENNLLEQVIVVGYGVQKKKDLTGSIAKVKGDQIAEVPVSRLDDALNGLASGVSIQNTNPAAGEAPTIKIRGQGSISFDSAPLIVVDGIAVGNDSDYLSSLDMNDVESVDVLKDASSSAIYGSRGANGVVMVTTKKGKEGPTIVSYNTYTGYKFVPKSNVLSTPEKWSEYVMSQNDGVLTPQMEYVNKMGTYTNWEDVMFDGGFVVDHNLSVRGGSKNTKFRASMSYSDDDGVMLTDNFKKVNVRLNLDSKLNKFEYGMVINPSMTTQRRFPINLVDAMRQSPWLPIYIDESNIQYVNRLRDNGAYANVQIGDYAMERMFDNYDLTTGQPVATGGTTISTTSNQNPYAKVVEINDQKSQTKVFASTYLKYNFTDDFNFQQNIGGDYKFTKYEEYRGVKATRNFEADSYSTYDSQTTNHLVAESTFNYAHEFGKNSVSALAGFAYEYWANEWNSIDGAGYINDKIQTIPAAYVTGANTRKADEKLISYLARINYAYDDKYLVMVSFRTDGSSKFGDNTKWGNFPAASLGWRISNEDFLIGNNTIRDLKLRASYGYTGSNSGIGEYDYLGLVNPVGTGLSGVSEGFYLGNIANPDLGWESLEEFDLGIDATLFGGVFGFSADYYSKTSQDLLIDLPVPAITGFESSIQNRGEVKNEGFEIELRSTNISTNDFLWTTTALISHNVNTLVSFPGSNGLISIIDDKRPAEWIAVEGNPISTFYGYVVSQEIALEYIKNPWYPINANAQDIYVKDINGDGLIDTDDRTILGNPYPDFMWSFTNNFSYKNWDLNFMFQGAQGAEVRNINSQYINNQFASNQDSLPTIPEGNFTREKIFTSDDIEDASYITLRNVNLGYSFPKDVLKKFGLRKLRLYGAGNNLMYIMGSDYTGYNPEGITDGKDNPLTYGYQKGAAPIYRTLSFGLNIEF